MDLSITGTISDPVVSPPASSSFGLTVGDTYSFSSATSSKVVTGELVSVNSVGAVIQETGLTGTSFVPWAAFIVQPA